MRPQSASINSSSTSQMETRKSKDMPGRPISYSERIRDLQNIKQYQPLQCQMLCLYCTKKYYKREKYNSRNEKYFHTHGLDLKKCKCKYICLSLMNFSSHFYINIGKNSCYTSSHYRFVNSSWIKDRHKLYPLL